MLKSYIREYGHGLYNFERRLYIDIFYANESGIMKKTTSLEIFIVLITWIEKVVPNRLTKWIINY